MQKSKASTTLQFGTPAIYRIVVQGKLDAHWSDRLAGMKVDLRENLDGSAQTTLKGLLRDQSELSGVLDCLHSLHLPIVQVEQIE